VFNVYDWTYEGNYGRREPIPDNQHRIELVNDNQAAKYAVVKAGKGDCSIILINNCLIIYDFGGVDSFPNIHACLENILEGTQIAMVFLILSHDDEDHIYYLREVIDYLRHRELPPEIFMISPLIRAQLQGLYDLNNIKIIGDATNFNTAPLTILFDDNRTKVTVVYPTERQQNRRNNNKNSLVVVVFVNDQTICLTGDQNFAQIHRALHQVGLTETTVFQIPHHGSRTNDWRIGPPHSKYYIISGTPGMDRQGVGYTGNHLRNMECQAFVAERLLTMPSNRRRFIIITQERIHPDAVQQLEDGNIGVILLIDDPYYIITLPTPPANQTAQ
jgi:hypothetical protein